MLLDVSLVQEVPARIAERRDQARRWVKERVYQAREQGETGLWNLHLQALDRAGSLVGKAETVPVIGGRLATDARTLLDRVERTTTAPPLADYDELNVRKVMAALRDLDRFGLLRLQRYEASHKSRKTILDAVDREVERRARLAAY